MNTSHWLANESLFANHGYDGTDANKLIYLRYPESKILLLAVHGVNHFRNKTGDLKPADLYTGGLALTLALNLKVNAIIVGCREKSLNPHAGQTHIDVLVAKHLQQNPDNSVVDIHGAVKQENFEIALGDACYAYSAGQAALIETVQMQFAQVGMRSIINDDRYSAKGHSCQTRRIRAAGHERVMQIEITRPWRDLAEDGAKAGNTLAAFKNVIERLSL